MIQKTFLRQKREWGSPAVGRIMQNLYRDGECGPCCPAASNRHCVLISNRGLEGWDPQETSAVLWQGTAAGGEGHLCSHSSPHSPALFAFLSRRCEHEEKNSCGLAILDLCCFILHQSCQGRTLLQDCTGLLGSFQCQFLYKGKKIPLHTHSGTRLGHEAAATGNTTRPLGCETKNPAKNPSKNPTKNPAKTLQKTPLLCHCPVQNHVDELRNVLGAVSRSSHRGNALCGHLTSTGCCLQAFPKGTLNKD